MTLTLATQAKLRLVSENDASEMILDSYVMHRSFQRCTHCDCMEQYSTIFEVYIHPTKTRTTGLNRLRLLASPALKNLPLAYLDLPIRIIPTCSDCIDEYEATGEKPLPASSREAWALTLRRKHTPEPSRSESPKTRIEPTLEQL